MVTELYLVGTAHIDTKGPERVRKILTHLRPNVISLELNEEKAPEVERMEAELRDPAHFERTTQAFVRLFSGANPETVRGWLQVQSFEYTVARDVAREMGIPLSYGDNVDTEAVMRELADPTSKGHQTMRRYLGMTPAALQRKMDTFYGGDLSELELDDGKIAWLRGRDEFAERKLRTLDGRVVHLGGMQHMFGSYHNLFQRLRNLSPERLPLSKADSF